MITLYKFGSKFNLPDPSPFVVKVEILLKMANLPYEVDLSGDTRKAPKEKFPYIEDDGITLGDSSLIRCYLEKKYQINFDADAELDKIPSAFLAEKYCEDNLYFLILSERWLNQENFNKGPKLFFKDVPWFMRSLITNKVCKDIKQTLWLQGLGRHTLEEKISLVQIGSDMLSNLLKEQSFFGGDKPCGSDAFIASLLCGVLNDYFNCPYQQYFSNHKNLVDYTKRMMEIYYPDYRPTF